MWQIGDLDSSQALDVNQLLSQLTGYGIVEGGEPEEGARPMAVDIPPARTIIDGEEVETTAASIDLDEYQADEEPRKVVLYIDPEGFIRVAAGEPATPEPRGALRFETYQPAPPDLSDMPGVPVAEVWIGAYSQHITDEDIRDRRVNATIEAYGVELDTADFDRLFDGSGAEKTGLASLSELMTETEIREAINTDADHGETAQHDYFSGHHADLEYASDDHHPRYGGGEAETAVEGSVDAAELTAGEPAAEPGYHLAVGDDATSLEWTSPQMAEAPLLDSGTVTHTGGSETWVSVSDLSPSEPSQFELGVALAVDSSPTWSGDYAFDVETSYRWDNTARSLNADLQITWDIDPGAGNDLELRYHVYEMRPELVSRVFESQDAIDAMDGAKMLVADLSIHDVFGLPVYDEPDAAAAVGDPLGEGDIITATDPDTDTYGEFLHDGTEWIGPYAEDVTSLTGLAIDVAKDWAGEPIQNVGTPHVATETATAAIRPVDIQSHGEQTDAHHAPTSSSDIDHAGVSNVQPDQHHPRFGDEDAVAVAAAEVFSMPIGATMLDNGESTTLHLVLDEFEQLRLYQAQVMTESGDSPLGLLFQIRDLDRDETIYGIGEEHHVASDDGSPVTRIHGPMRLGVRLVNHTGMPIAAGGEVSYRIAEVPYSYGDKLHLFADNGSRVTDQRRGVVVSPRTELVGFEVTLSNYVEGATTAYLMTMDGQVLATEDITGMVADDVFSLIIDDETGAISHMTSASEYVVAFDADGGEYTAGQHIRDGQFPYEAEQFAVTAGYYGGQTVASNRYNVYNLRAIYD